MARECSNLPPSLDNTPIINSYTAENTSPGYPDSPVLLDADTRKGGKKHFSRYSLGHMSRAKSVKRKQCLVAADFHLFSRGKTFTIILDGGVIRISQSVSSEKRDVD